MRAQPASRTRGSFRSDPSQTSDFTEVATGMALFLLGGAALGGLFFLANSVRLDSVLVISKTIFNIISGIRAIGLGIGQLATGLLEAAGLILLALAAVISVLAAASGLLRMLSRLIPQLSAIWTALAVVLNLVVGVLGIPQPRRTNRGIAGPVHRPMSPQATAHPSGRRAPAVRQVA